MRRSSKFSWTFLRLEHRLLDITDSPTVLSMVLELEIGLVVFCYCGCHLLCFVHFVISGGNPIVSASKESMVVGACLSQVV